MSGLIDAALDRRRRMAALVTRERERRPAWRGRGPWRGWRCCSHCGHLLHFWAFRLRCPRHDCKLGGDPQ